MKTYDYINRVVITLPLMVYKGTCRTLFPSCCYVLRLELALVFPEEEGVMQHSSVSISLSF